MAEQSSSTASKRIVSSNRRGIDGGSEEPSPIQKDSVSKGPNTAREALTSPESDSWRLDQPHGIERSHDFGVDEFAEEQSNSERTSEFDRWRDFLSSNQIDRAHSSAFDAVASSDPSDREVDHQWLRHHAIELIDRLQTWADNLRRREDNLTMQLVELERAQREFRRVSQQQQIDRQREKEDLNSRRENLKTAARWLALADHL
ncbi:MAG: hypothetical protein AAF664_26580 [Planctomycetota bacterium]